MKNSDRVFILGCGHSSMTPYLLDFLKDEYVIAVSQWAFLYDQFPFDFYYMNDNYRWASSSRLQTGMSDFFQLDVPTWSKSLGEGTFPNETNFFSEFGKNKQFGKHTYTSIKWTNNFDLNSELFPSGVRTTDEIERYFTDEYFSKIKICATGYGSVIRCAVDLAFNLRFKNCFLLNLDTIPFPGESYYNKYVDQVYRGKNNDVECINRNALTQEKSVWTDGYRSSVFFEKIWKTRYDAFSKHNMVLKRAIPQGTHEYEQNFCSYNDKRFTKETVDFYTKRQHFFERVLLEDVMQGKYESTQDSKIVL